LFVFERVGENEQQQVKDRVLILWRIDYEEQLDKDANGEEPARDVEMMERFATDCEDI
jgi:hypothetical protein